MIATRSFKNGFAGYSIIANELIVVVYYSVISSKYILESRSTEAENALTCIYIVLLAVIVFILFNIAATLRNIYSWIQKRRAKPKVIPANITLEQSGDPNQSVKVPEFLDNE